ncbi:hypothetical protein [Corynebacterium liangguodongii]|uniref:Uncharacterized protein n=1 Tax=Corynebacterium liangguodongii TaxID=2079535 RepID=A0A2S0WBP0_9CORY|nr:hypothetical protein [Corynebacterium liangguodongii]AWB83189.1 hypothetical protein C3E79_00750 [Corynebacterium liangguodongii]PWB98784.1 hypothetical protein DF219_10210 [Corynebacterium liangguodongii]
MRSGDSTNGLDDRPFEGDLSTDVYDELMYQARQTSSAPVIKRRHLEGAIASALFMSAVYTLERYNPDTKEATKGPLFTTNPIRTDVKPDTADTLIDALDIIEGSDRALTANNPADLPGGYDADAVVEELEAKGLAFQDPLEPEEWIPRHRYLSGAVRTKLRMAEDLASADEYFVITREALRQELVERGMDESRSRFIHEWDDRNLELFDDYKTVRSMCYLQHREVVDRCQQPDPSGGTAPI